MRGVAAKRGVALLGVMAGCGGTQVQSAPPPAAPAPLRADEVAREIARSPEFARAVSAALEELDAGVALGATVALPEPPARRDVDRVFQDLAAGADSSDAAAASDDASATAAATAVAGDEPARAAGATDAPQPAVETRGMLGVASTPQGNVCIDGRSVGATPLAPREVTAGQHTVLAYYPGRHVWLQREVEIHPGERLIVAFHPDDPYEHPASHPTVAECQLPGSESADPNAPAILNVVADPSATVRVDGAPAGPTPVFDRAIPPGVHNVLATHGRVRRVQRVEVRGGQRVLLRFDFTNAGRAQANGAHLGPNPGMLGVAATPYANIRIDGRPVGTTPLAVRPVQAGMHTIEATNPSLDAHQTRRVRVHPGERLVVRFDMTQ